MRSEDDRVPEHDVVVTWSPGHSFSEEIWSYGHQSKDSVPYLLVGPAVIF